MVMVGLLGMADLLVVGLLLIALLPLVRRMAIEFGCRRRELMVTNSLTMIPLLLAEHLYVSHLFCLAILSFCLEVCGMLNP